MIKVININCQNCGSDYFVSDNNSYSIMSKCIDCGVQLSLPGAIGFMVLKNKFEEELFYQNYKSLNSSELKQYIYNQSKIFQEKLEREEAERQRLLKEERRRQELEKQKLKNIKIQKLKNVLNENYLNARNYWEQSLKDWLSEEDFNHVITNYVIDWFEKHHLDTPDYEQAHTIANVWDNVQVVARAGSGKTRTIINRTIFLIKHCGINPNEIIILAFNKKAASEINERLEKSLDQHIPQAMTFHALAYGIVHPEENLIYDELETLQKSSSVQQVIDSFLRDKKYSSEIKEIMMNYFREDWENIINKGFNLNKNEMVEYRRALPYIGLDGKYYKSIGEKRIADYLFEHNIPYYYERNFWWGKINYKPDFTILKKNNRYQGIVIEYFGMSGDIDYDINTQRKIKFWEHKDDYEFLSLFPEDAKSTDKLNYYVYPILTEYFPNVRKMSDEEIWYKIKDRAVDEFSIICKTFIERSRKLMKDPDDLKDLVIDEKHNLTELELMFLRVIWKIYFYYLDYLNANNEEDFDGLLYRAINKIKQGQDSWKRKSGSGNFQNIKYLFIDEFQDFSMLFNELIDSIRLINNQVKLFCVGDDWQAINGFAGSDIKYFYEFKENIANSKKLNISTNYRSVKKVVEAGNQLMVNEGVPSKADSNEDGEVLIADLDNFEPNYHEKKAYDGDVITPALVRIVKGFVDNGQRVALLSRRKRGLPWYNINESRNKDFRENLVNRLRGEFPSDKRELIVTVDTVHSFKGKEEEGIIILDAIDRSFPLLHPRNIFYQVLGHTLEKVYSEEKRLFYVALSRAESKLVIITDSMNKSPFLSDIFKNKITDILDINRLNYPIKSGSRYSIIVSNRKGTTGTIPIRELLKSSGYNYDAAKQSWYKIIGAKYFSEKQLLCEIWVKEANNVLVKVRDEFEQIVLAFMVIEGKIHKSKSKKILLN